MHAVLVEAVPAGTVGILTEDLQESADAIIERIMLARHEMDPIDLHILEELARATELLGLREMGDVAGMDREGGARIELVHIADGTLKRSHHIGIGLFIEADM